MNNASLRWEAEGLKREFAGALRSTASISTVAAGAGRLPALSDGAEDLSAARPGSHEPGYGADA